MIINKPIVSFCIPSNGRVEILKKTLECFFDLNIDVDISLYEICISDNSQTNETEDMLKIFFNKKNIVYKKSNILSYLNLIESLKLGNGSLLKLHNDYSIFKKGMLALFINEIKIYVNTKPCMFFTSGNIKLNNRNINDFDIFLQNISYWSTSATCFSIWKDDFDMLYRHININNMFPHTSFLFNSHYKSEFIIDNQLYIENQPLEKKGGYHITKTFCVDYIEMLYILFEENIITKKTYKLIKSDILYNFFPQWYVDIIIYKDKFTFDISNTFRYLCIYYNKIEILFFYFLVRIHLLFKIIKRCVLFIRRSR